MCVIIFSMTFIIKKMTESTVTKMAGIKLEKSTSLLYRRGRKISGFVSSFHKNLMRLGR